MFTDIITAGADPNSGNDIGPIVQSIINAGDTPVFPDGNFLWQTTVNIPDAKKVALKGSRTAKVQTTQPVPLIKYNRTPGMGEARLAVDGVQFNQIGTAGTGVLVEFKGPDAPNSNSWVEADHVVAVGFAKAFDLGYCAGKVAHSHFYNNGKDFALSRGASFLTLTDVFALGGEYFVYGVDPLADAYSNGIMLNQCTSVYKGQTDVSLDGWDALMVQGGGYDLGGSGNGSGQAAFRLARCTNVKINDLWCAGNPGTPKANRAGMLLIDSRHVQIKGCSIKSHSRGIWAQGPSSYSAKHWYEDNDFEANSLNHIIAVGSKGGVIAGNMFHSLSRGGTNYELFLNASGTSHWSVMRNQFAGSSYTISAGTGSIVDTQMWGVPL